MKKGKYILKSNLMISFIPYILALMIIYDFSIHLIYLLGMEEFFLKRKINYWPEWEGRKYQVFWSIFWGIALVLILIYIYANL